MENTNLKLAILNLAGELPQELADYLVQREIKVVSPSENQEVLEWTHILTKDQQDFSLLAKTYQTLERNVKIISLTKVLDPQNFILANGKLILDQIWMEGPLGKFILDKFFQEYAGITMGDNYPKFEETGFFNITNPFSTGDYLDRLVHKAFESDFAALSIKTYFDHILMFLTGLKNKGKVGMPIEVTYGAFDDVFGLQLHFFADGLMLEDITTCLSNSITKKAEEYLLNIAVQSADFFDFTFLSQVKKVVITGLWTKNERVKFENRGMMFTTLTQAASLTNIPYEGLTSQLMSSTEVDDQSEKINLPEKLQEEESLTVSGEDLSETLAEKISSKLELEQIQQILRGEIPDEDPTKIVVGSQDEMQELVNLVKGGAEEEAEAYKISGSKLDADDFAMRISSGLAEKAKEKGILNVKSLGEKLPDAIKTGLFDFAKGLNKSVEDLNGKDIHIFNSQHVPNLIQSHTIIGNTIPKQLRQDIKTKLEQGLMREFQRESADAALSSLQGEDDELRLKHLLKNTLKSTLQSNFHLTEKTSISEVEKDLLVKSLSVSLEEDENKIREIVTNQKSPIQKPLFNAPVSENEKKLQLQLQAAQAEIENFKGKMRAMYTEIKVLKDSQKQMASIQAKAQQAAAEAVTNIPDQDEQLREHFQQKLSAEEVLNKQEQQKLKDLLEREAKLIKTAKEEELKARKIQIESVQKEALFNQQLEMANREIKARDIMFNKTKEALTKLTEKKDAEVKSMQIKLDNLSLAISQGPSQSHMVQIRDLEKQNQNLAKMVDMYKAKVASMVTNLQSNKSDDGSSKEEVRRLQMLNQQFKNQADAAKREVQKYQDKVAYDMTQISAIRAEKVKLEGVIKKMTQELKKEQLAPQNHEMEQELKKAQSEKIYLENQFKDLTIKLKEAETRLADALKSGSKQVTGMDDSKKVAHLEGSVKKLSQDLIEARNQAAEMKKETNKLRQEKTAIQNLLDKMKKEADKAKAASPKGGKAA